MIRKSAKEIRAEAVKLARVYANERFTDGDPEGASVLRDLAQAIARIRLTVGR